MLERLQRILGSPWLLLFLAAVFAFIAFDFANDIYPRGGSFSTRGGGDMGGVDTGADGGAAGFAVLSGFCILSYTIRLSFVRKP